MTFTDSQRWQNQCTMMIGALYDKDAIMESGNLINFIAYCKQRHTEDQNKVEKTPSEELGVAIQHLIERLRDCEPLNQIS